MDIAVQHRRHSVETDVVASGDFKWSAHGATEIADGAAAVLHLREDAAGVSLQGSPRFREADLAADAVEELGVERIFQCSYPFAHCGLGKMQLLRRQGERTVFGDGEEGVEIFDVHA